jgi:methyltransferase-like protein 6
VPEIFVLFILLRNWIQATFTLYSSGSQSLNGQRDLHVCEGKEDKLVADSSKNKSSSEEIDLSEDFCNMFGTSHKLNEVTVPMHPMLYCHQIQPFVLQ